MMTRIFIGTFIEKNIFENIYSEIQEDFEEASIGKWVEQENIHFTVKFIGDIDDSKVPAIREAVLPYLKTYESPLIIKGIGAIPNIHKPRVMYVPVSNPDMKLFIAQRKIEKALKPVGIDPDKKKFKAHVTLQRIKKNYRMPFKKAVNKYSNYDFGTMDSFRICLIHSKLTHEGPIYTIMD